MEAVLVPIAVMLVAVKLFEFFGEGIAALVSNWFVRAILLFGLLALFMSWLLNYSTTAFVR